MSQKRWVVGVDVGGTFTDLFVLDEQTGTARIVKVPSTRGEAVSYTHLTLPTNREV